MINLILLHGYTENSTLWDKVVPLLGTVPNLKVTTIDLPGFGKNASLISRGMHAMAEYILNDLKLRNIEKFVVMGHSMGGYVALEMLNQAPTRFLGLGLIHSHPKADDKKKIEARNKAIKFVEHHGLHHYLKEFAPTLVSPENQKNEEMMAAITEMLSGNHVEGITNALRSMAGRRSYENLLAMVRFPVLMVAGRQDLILPVESTFKDATLARQTDLEVFDECGHCSPIEMPDRLAEVIKNYIGEIRKLQPGKSS